MDVSIVIPTKNGGALFDEVLTMIDKLFDRNTHFRLTVKYTNRTFLCNNT